MVTACDHLSMLIKSVHFIVRKFYVKPVFKKERCGVWDFQPPCHKRATPVWSRSSSSCAVFPLWEPKALRPTPREQTPELGFHDEASVFLGFSRLDATGFSRALGLKIQQVFKHFHPHPRTLPRTSSAFLPLTGHLLGTNQWTRREATVLAFPCPQSGGI